MASKREYDDVDDGEIQEPQPQPKRSKKHTAKARQHQNSSIDPTWGQKYVFSNVADATTIPRGEESDFEDDADAMAYLSSVRREANEIPHLLVAPKPHIGPQLPPELQTDGAIQEQDDDNSDRRDMSIYESGVGDARGYYDDGAYMAMPESDDDDRRGMSGAADTDDGNDTAREAAISDSYFISVMRRYKHLRSILHTTPPSGAAGRLSAAQPTYAAPFSRHSSTTKTWTRVILTTDPHPLQVALMSKDTVIRVLRVLLGGKFLRRETPPSQRTSHWLWALLARLPDRGGLNHAEVGWVRDLGRRAVLLGRSLAEMAALRDELAENGLGVHDAVDGSSSDDAAVAENGVEDSDYDSPDDERPQTVNSRSPAPSAGLLKEKASADLDEGEVDEGEIPDDEPASGSEGEDMDLESNQSDSDDARAVGTKTAGDLEEAKRALLERIQNIPDSSEQKQDTNEEDETEGPAQINTRATLNMILTITGEFYGQRDLLEFREPFGGV